MLLTRDIGHFIYLNGPFPMKPRLSRTSRDVFRYVMATPSFVRIADGNAVLMVMVSSGSPNCSVRLMAGFRLAVFILLWTTLIISSDGIVILRGTIGGYGQLDYLAESERPGCVFSGRCYVDRVISVFRVCIAG